MTISFQQWIQQGESLYQAAIKEMQSLQSELEEVQARLASKQTEVNQMAQLLGKAPPKAARSLLATAIVCAPIAPAAIPPVVAGPDRQLPGTSNNVNIARALAGKSVR